MVLRFQYQGRSEPVSLNPETVQLDKFNPIVPVPYRKNILSTAVLAAGMFFVELVSAPAETITLDKWYQPISQPVIVAKQPLRTDYLSLVEFSVPEDVTLDKWCQPISQPVITVKQPLRTDWLSFVTFEEVTLDKWYQPASEPVRVPPQIVRQYYDIDANLLTQGENISLDKWYSRQMDMPMWSRPDINRWLGSITIDPWILTQGIAATWEAPSYCYGAFGYTGGGRALDGITTPAYQDFAIVVASDYSTTDIYYFDTTSSAAESSPDTIAPDDGTTGRWIRMKFSNV